MSEPLRNAVLAGKFFSSDSLATANELAEFIARKSATLADWFGVDEAARLAADPSLLICHIDRDIAMIDRAIGRQLDAILHHPRLRRLEGTWRGISWLTSRLSLSGRVKVRLLNVTWPEIVRDLERAPAIDQSNLFRVVYEQEFGIAGGEPYGLLVVDHEVRHRPGPGAITDDISAIASLSGVAAAAFVPLVINAAPALLGVDNFAGLSGVNDPAAVISGPDYQRWKSLASREDIRFIAVALPRTLARTTWDEALDRHRGFRYRETSVSVEDKVWSGAGFMIAACVIRAFDAFAWPADIRGYDIDRLGGGIVEDLPEPHFSIDPPGGAERPAQEILLTDHQERALVAAGLLPIGSLPYGGQALVGATRSLQVPNTSYIGMSAAAASANAKLSAQFNTMICVSRFAHYLKVMGRDMVGAFKTAPEIQKKLQDWLMRYATASTTGGAETMAKYPLRGAAVTITENPAKPGVYGCVIQLQPHYQLDDIAASFRLMTEIAAPGVR